VVIDSFEAVRRLGDAELRALLDSGRPEQRVWAIWALAMRSVSNVGMLVVHEDPDPGVRRNLAVVLAGHGEHDLLVALAHRDPAPEVRAAAMQLVARLAIDGSLPDSFVTERALADSAEVKIAVLGTVFEDAPEWLRELAQRLLADRDSDVRYESFEALVRVGEIDAALMWLEELPEMEARLALMRWSARGNARACAERLAGSSRRLRRLLIESVRAPTWKDLSPAIGADPTLLRALLQRDVAQLERVPLEPLVRATIDDERGGWLGAVRAKLTGLESAPEGLVPLLPLLYELCARRIADLERELARWRGEDEELAIELEDARLAVEAAIEHVSRLLVH
jgi:hypothetical protein